MSEEGGLSHPFSRNKRQTNNNAPIDLTEEGSGVNVEREYLFQTFCLCCSCACRFFLHCEFPGFFPSYELVVIVVVSCFVVVVVVVFVVPYLPLDLFSIKTQILFIWYLNA